MFRDIHYVGGFHTAMKEYLEEAIGPEFSRRLVSTEKNHNRRIS